MLMSTWEDCTCDASATPTGPDFQRSSTIVVIGPDPSREKGQEKECCTSVKRYRLRSRRAAACDLDKVCKEDEAVENEPRNLSSNEKHGHLRSREAMRQVLSEQCVRCSA